MDDAKEIADLRKVFATNMRERRKNFSWSQEELAAQADLHRTYIGDIERSERNVSIDNIGRIARALETSACELLKKR